MKSTETGLDTDATERIMAGRRNEAVPVTAEEMARLLVTFFYQSGDDPFIYKVHGNATVSALADIEKQAIEYAEETFKRGDGDYCFSATWFPVQYGDEGRCEFQPGFELDEISFEPAFKESAICPDCEGKGWYAENDPDCLPHQVQCFTCYGTGKVTKERS